MHWAIAAAVAWILLSKGRAAGGTWSNMRGEGEDPIPGENGLSDYWQRHPPTSIVQPLPTERLLPIQDPYGDTGGGTQYRCMAIGCEGGYPDYGLRLIRPLEPAPVPYLEDPIEGTPVASYLPYAGGYRILPVIAE